MAKNFQLNHILAQNKPYSNVFAALNLSTKELCAVKISDLETIDDSQLILVKLFIKIQFYFSKKLKHFTISLKYREQNTFYIRTFYP